MDKHKTENAFKDGIGNPKLPSPSNIKQNSRLKRNNGIGRQYLNFRESFPTKIYIWHLSDVRFK